MNEATNQVYLGDGVYAAVISEMIRLHTSDGRECLDVIYIERPVAQSLVDYINQIFGIKAKGELQNAD